MRIDFAHIEQQAQAGVIYLHGLKIAVQHPRNSYRKGKDAQGHAWANRMAAHYGEITGTLGADGDPIDCYVGEWPYADSVYVVNQGFNDQFDEHKVMLGFYDQQAAINAYQLSFPDNWRGLDSLVPCSLSQFKWWLKNGNKQRKLEADHLPYEGTTMLKRIHWGQDALPLNINLDDLLMSIRREATPEIGDLLMDSVTMADILDDADEIVVLDALVRPFSALKRTAEMLRRSMNRTEFSVKAPDPAQGADKVFTKNGKAQVAVLIPLSDGQTITVYFHNPDTTPKKIAANDDMISWKWLLNKRDITILVAPESGSDLNINEVAKRIMALADKNSASFQRINAKKAETVQRIEGLKTEINQLESDLGSAKQRLEAAKSKKLAETTVADSKAASLVGLAIVKSALGKYGASLTEQAFIVNSLGAETDVKAVIKGRRLRFEDQKGKLISSGPVTEDFVSSFVEKYWYWKVINPSLSDAFKAASEPEPKETTEENKPTPDLLTLLESEGFKYQGIYPATGASYAKNDDGYVVAAIQRDKGVTEVWVSNADGSTLYGGNFNYGEGQMYNSTKAFEYTIALIKDDADPAETQHELPDTTPTIETEMKPEDITELPIESVPVVNNQAEIPEENEANEAVAPDPYASRIEALKTMPRTEYDAAIDDLINELDEKGLLSQYEAQLTEIDKSRVSELSAMVSNATNK